MRPFVQRLSSANIVLITLLFFAFLLSGHAAHAVSPFIIAIGGGSTSGKAQLARKIVAALNEGAPVGQPVASMISADNYFAPERQPKKFYVDGEVNYDHPSAVDLEKLALHLQSLKGGMSVTIPKYTFGRAVKKETIINYNPTPIIVIEGIFSLRQELAKYVDFKVFVDVDRKTRFEHRIKRDQDERGWSEKKARKYFEHVVEPMHDRYIKPLSRGANVIVKNPEKPAEVPPIVQLVKTLASQSYEKQSTELFEAYNGALEKLAKSKSPNFIVASFAQVTPTQLEIGYTNLARRTERVDSVLREGAANGDLPKRLEDFIESHAITVIKRGRRLFMVDHHHLALVYKNKGFSKLFLEIVETPPEFDESRLKLKNAQGNPLKWEDLQNNPYRSLVGLLQATGAIEKTGVPHEEFAWASYFQKKFETQGRPLTEADLLDSDARDKAIKFATRLAKRPEARALLASPIVPRGMLCRDLFR